VLAANAALLRSAGLEVEARDRAAAEDLADFDLVMPLLVRGYPFAPLRWGEASDCGGRKACGFRIRRRCCAGTPTRIYLERLAERGAPVVPTCHVERADRIRGLDGAPLLIELELIEPDLYLGYDRQAGARFSAAVLELIAR